MASLYGNNYDKVTFNMPIELKEKVMALKDELNIPLSTIFNEVISNYIKHKEMQKWENAVELALKDSSYIESIKENGFDSGDIYEY